MSSSPQQPSMPVCYFHESTARKVDDIDSRTAVMEGRLNGEGQEPGLMTRVAQIEKWIEGQVWFHRTVIISVVGLLVSGLGVSVAILVKLSALAK